MPGAVYGPHGRPCVTGARTCGAKLVDVIDPANVRHDPAAPVVPGSADSSMSTARRTGWPTIIIVTLVALLLPLRAALHAAGPAMEEGFMLVLPDRVLHGAIANRDFLWLYGPGALWVLAAVYKVFGTHLLVERIAGLIQIAGMALGAAALVRWWGRWVAASAAVLSVVFVMPTLLLTAIPWTGGAAIAFASIVSLLEARHSTGARDDARARWWAFAGGVLAAFAMLYRVDLALALVLAGTAALWGTPLTTVKRALLGLAVGLVPSVVHIVLAGPGTVWQRMLIDPVFRLRSGRSLPIPPNPGHLEGIAKVIVLFDRSWPLPRLSIPQQLFVWFMLLALLAVGLVALAIWAVRRAPAAFRPRVLLAGALFGLGMFPQALQRDDSAHLAWVSAVIVVLVPAAITELVCGLRPRWSLARVGPVAGLSVILATSLLFPTFTARRYIALVQDSFDAPKTIAITRHGRTFYVGDDPALAHSIESLLDAVARNVKPGGRVIVGNTDLRRVPNVDSFLYYLLPDYEPGTFSVEFEPGLTNRKGTPLTAEMHRADAFIASDRWIVGWSEPNTSMKPGDPGPGEVLRDEFCLRGDFGRGYKLFLRCVAKTPDS